MNHVPQLDEIFKPIHHHLQQFENYFLKNIKFDSDLLTQIGQHILSLKGKRIRPALLFLAGLSIKDNNYQDLYLAAQAIELTHTASLLHDDVVDQSSQRRFQKTAHVIWGNQQSILSGDYFFIFALNQIIKLKNLTIIDLMTNTTMMMAQGELLQLEQNKLFIDEADCFKIISHKTASIMGTSVKIAAILQQASEEQIEKIYQFGINFGMAFQIIDDILDYNLQIQNTGKQHGTDLKEKKITLPLAYLIKKVNSQDHQRIQSIFNQNTITNDHLIEIYNLMQQYQIFDYCQNKAQEFINNANLNLLFLPENCYRKSLQLLSNYILYRTQ